MHNHVYPAGTEPHPQHGPRTGSSQKEGAPPPFPEPPQKQDAPSTGPELSLASETKQSGFAAVCASFVLDFAATKEPGDARQNLLRWFTAIDRQLAAEKMQRALTLNDLTAAHAQGKPTIVQTVEGAQFLEGKLERVEEVYRRGLRHLQLLHMSDDLVAPLGDTNTEPPKYGGLTVFGAQVVKECNRLGIVVDMAHASHETVLGALKVSTQPLVISHTNLDTWAGSNPRMAEMMKPRLISKEHARVVAEAGGIVGVWTHLTSSPEEFVKSVGLMVDAIGVDHVGIGTDTDLLSKRAGAGTNQAWTGVTEGFLPVVISEMLQQGFAEDAITKIAGGNYCRVFGAVTGGRA